MSLDEVVSEHKRQIMLNAIGGGTAGAAVDCLLFPLDTIKTRLQTGQKSAKIYAGLLSAVCGSFPSAAVFLSTYEFTRTIWTDHCGFKADLAPAAAAVVADISACVVRVPFEVVKQRLQIGMHKNTVDAVKTIIQTQGIAALYSGYWSIVMREIPFDVAEFLLYEKGKKIWAELRGKKSCNHWESSVIGSISGGIAAAITTPLDVIKTRLMTQDMATAPNDRYNGVIDAFTRISREEGTSALFRGIIPRVLWISLGGAIFFGTYERAKVSFYPYIYD